MPFPLIPVLIGLFIAAAVIALLDFRTIIDWFTGRSNLKQSDKDNVAFTVQERLQSGNYKTVQGIFNQRTSKVVDGKAYESKDLDSELKEIHAGQQLVVYN